MAAQAMGQEKRHQLDWLRDNQQALEPLISEWNTAFSRWLRSQSPRDRQAKVAVAVRRRVAANEAKHCKNLWFQAKEVEKAVRDGEVGRDCSEVELAYMPCNTLCCWRSEWQSMHRP